jgi:hypothetical protein
MIFNPDTIEWSESHDKNDGEPPIGSYMVPLLKPGHGLGRVRRVDAVISLSSGARAIVFHNGDIYTIDWWQVGANMGWCKWSKSEHPDVAESADWEQVYRYRRDQGLREIFTGQSDAPKPTPFFSGGQKSARDVMFGGDAKRFSDSASESDS